jgi:hypothetical protein
MNMTAREWEQKLRDVPLQRIDPRTWPDGIRPLTFDEEGFGVDRNHVLYWNGKPVTMRRQLELRWYELILATSAALAVVVQATASVLLLLG